jgi:D-3-phosphoglycerate dehydrogenase
MANAQITEPGLTAPRALIVDLLRWLDARERSYRETMDAWRTSCPRLPVWEDAVDNGFVEIGREEGGDVLLVAITPTGRAFLERHAR